MAEPPKGSDSYVLRLLHRFGLHPFSRVLKPRKVAGETNLLQPAGDAAPVPPIASEEPTAE